VPCQLFPTADGQVFLMCMTPKFWDLLVAELDEPALREPRFASIALRREHKTELIPLLDAQFARRSTQAWLDALAGKLPIAPVHDLAQALDSGYVARQGLLQATPHPAAAGLRLLASPIKLDGVRLPGRACSALGSDTQALLGALAPTRGD